MSAPKHTPGPWVAAIYDVTPAMRERLKFQQWAVARNDDPSKAIGELVALCGDINPDERAASLESMADAHLIAAAPDLLEALDRAHLQIIQLLNDGDFKRNIELDLGYIVDAIAKAEGRSTE